MKVIIAGTREFTDYDLIKETIENSGYDVTEVICGGARGTDYFGEIWALENKIPISYFLADWKHHGKSAGPKRNQLMGKYADAAIIFWDGQSKGTKNMIDIMKKADKPYIIKRVKV